MEEDPKSFIENSKIVSNHPKEMYLQILPQEFKGQTATWLQNLQGLNLGWQDCKKELLTCFYSDGVKAAVSNKFLTEVHPTGLQVNAGNRAWMPKTSSIIW